MAETQPVIGMILLGGPLSGALIRDIRLANELAGRGYPVHVWWAMDRTDQFPLDERIQQHWLFHAGRYYRPKVIGLLGAAVWEQIGHWFSSYIPDRKRVRSLQKRSWIQEAMMAGMIKRVCTGVEKDRVVLNRLVDGINRHHVTHILPMLSVLCPWVAAAKRQVKHPLKYAVTFQGYELYVNYARRSGQEDELYRCLQESVDASDYQAIAVSEDYRLRVAEDIGIPLEKTVAIPPGIPTPAPTDRQQSKARIRKAFRDSYQEDRPLITFVGRRDSEKGIDLLLYAAKLLKQRGVDFQLAVCGPTLFGNAYSQVCTEIAENLRCPVLWKRFIPDDLRTALYAGSDCVVYPSIHREPFGMVPVEAMAHGTPALVPNQGGIAGVVEVNGYCGGLRFAAWDSGDCADQLQRLLEDRELWQQLAKSGPKVAAYFSVENLADRVLAHIGLPKTPIGNS